MHLNVLSRAVPRTEGDTCDAMLFVLVQLDCQKRPGGLAQNINAISFEFVQLHAESGELIFVVV